MKKVFSSFIYVNPLPQLRARNSAFAGICQLTSGKLLAAHQMGEAFESVDGTTYISESTDGGKTWSAPRQVFDKTRESIPSSDCGKITQLPDGRLILLGYAFLRPNPELPIGNPANGGLLEDKVFYSISEDEGKTWSNPKEIPTAWNGHTEASAPLTVLQDGSWATPITGFPDWEAKPVSRNCGRLLRSYDQGKTWNDEVVCMAFPGDTVTCYEQRMCQTMQGTLVVIGWNEDMKTGGRMNNHVTFSIDNGKSFSAPVDTGIHGQASSLIALDGEKVLSIHAVRRDTDAPGVYVCIADVAGGKWKTLSTECIWTPQTPMVQNVKVAEVFSFLKFGQPGGVLLSDGSLLLSQWICEEGCYKTMVNCYQF